jgi:tRNA U34 5-carboxymethylaminomethyl modifying GTPase MnmE/TrmE
MLEYLSPIVTLFKLILDGLSRRRDISKSGHKKELQRRVIEIQLCLEDIIDRAQEILSLVDQYSHKGDKFRETDIRRLQWLLYKQNNKIRLLLNMLAEPESDEMMKVFAPSTRRKIIALINFKGGFISELTASLWSFDRVKLVNKQAIVETYILNWNHDNFLKRSDSYLDHLDEDIRKRNTVSLVISDRRKEQEQTVKALIKCSKEFSSFIRSHIKIEDIILRKTK